MRGGAAVEVAAAIRVRCVSRAARLAFVLTAALAVALLVAPAAMGADGEGIYGRTDDKVVTFAAFIVIGFFAVLVTVLSLIQIRLESRKERAREDLERLRRP
jgi:fatty acid desaturase